MSKQTSKEQFIRLLDAYAELVFMHPAAVNQISERRNAVIAAFDGVAGTAGRSHLCPECRRQFVQPAVEPEPPTAPTSEEQLRATAQQMLNDGYSHMLVDPLDILRLTGQSGGEVGHVFRDVGPASPEEIAAQGAFSGPEDETNEAQCNGNCFFVGGPLGCRARCGLRSIRRRAG